MSKIIPEGVNEDSRYLKGFKYERQIWDLLDNIGLEYQPNPIVFEQWKEETNKGFDIKLNIPRKGWLKVECKFISKPIFSSWFVRDWLSRDADIFVTNCKWNVPLKERQTLKERGSKLLETHEFYSYLLRLNRKTRTVTNRIFECVSNYPRSNARARVKEFLRKARTRVRLRTRRFAEELSLMLNSKLDILMDAILDLANLER